MNRTGIVFIMVLAALVLVMPGASATDWQQFQYDVANTGNSPADAPDDNTIKWTTANIGAVEGSQAMIKDDKVFVYTNTEVYALNKDTGGTLWSTFIWGDTSDFGSWASPAYSDDKLYVSSGYNISRINTADGVLEQLVPFPDGGHSCNGGPAVADGVVYAGSGYGSPTAHYYALDASNLTIVLWSFSVGSAAAGSTPAVAGDMVVFGNGSSLTCVNKAGGALLWTTDLSSGTVLGSAAIDSANDRVYVATGSGSLALLHALELSTGYLIWTSSTPIDFTDGTPAILDMDHVYISGNVYGASGHTYCFNVTGVLQWTVPCGSWVMSPAVADGKLFTGDCDDMGGWGFFEGIGAYDAMTGALIWEYDYGGSSPAVADGIVFTIGGDGKVYAFGEPPKPDLVSISLVPGMLYSNQQSTITATIANDGAAGATAFNVSLEYEGTTIGITTIDSLDAGVETTTEFSWTPASTGTFGLTVTVDPENAIDESNETNNNLTRAILVKESIDWQQFHRDVGHVGFSQSDAPHTNHTAWMSDDIGAHTGSSTAIAEGKVFVYCNDYLVCLDEHTGAVLWNVSVEKTPDVCGSWVTPAYNDGNVFLSANKTYCFDATDGSEVWSFAPPTGKGAVDGGCTIADGKVFTSDWDGGYYYCLDVADGSVIWDFAVGGKAQSTPAVSVADGHVFFGSYTGICEDGGVAYCVDIATGAEIWNITTDNSFCGSVAIGEGVVYLTEYNFDGDGALYALDASNGSVLWSQPIERTDSTPALAYGNVYISGGVEGMTDLVTYCFNATTGNLLWSTSASDEIGSWKCSVAVADGLVFSGKPYFSYPVMDFVGTYALDSATGDVIWSYPAGGSSPAVADGMLITIGSGRVYAFRSVNVASCDATGSEKDKFCPGETVYVSGVGLSPDTDYRIWIQDDGVCEGDTLVAGDDPSISQECVTTDVNGDFGPIAIWTIPEGAAPTHQEYDIVIDDGDNVYHTFDDGIDSLGTTGFTAPVPELSGIILVAIGLVVLIGFVRRRW